MNHTEEDSRRINTRGSFFDVLSAYIFENPYEYTIHTNDLCARAGRSRMTFNRLYNNVGDILKWTDNELFGAFQKINFDREDLLASWRNVVLFIFKNRVVFKFELETYRGDLFRKMMEFLWDLFGMSDDKFLFEMFYAETFCVLRVWSMNGMEIANFEKVVGSLSQLLGTIEKRWGDSSVHL